MNLTIKDIARAAGVSHPTVSRALNNNPAISEATREFSAEARFSLTCSKVLIPLSTREISGWDHSHYNAQSMACA